MDHLYFDLCLCVCKGTKLFKIALYVFVSVSFAKFGLVPVWVVHLFDFIMRIMAVLIITFMVRAKLMTICIKICSPSISFIMVVNASFSLVKVYVIRDVPLRGHGFVL